MKEQYSNFKFIFEAITGSHLYGTNTPESDTDIRGVFIPSREYFYGFSHRVEQLENKTSDIVYFDIRKFFNLAAQCNPNIVELLFIPKEMSVLYTDIWNEVVENRELFLSKKARYTFSGYAHAQLKRIKQHRNWLLNPPKQQPKRGDFGLPDKKLIDEDQFNAMMELSENFNPSLVEVSGLDINAMDVLQREKAYRNAINYWNQYLEWQKNRNPKRAELEKKFGHDTKHSAHLVRLVSEGEELLLKKNITFPRPDAKLLLDIKNGKYSYDELMELVGDIDTKFDTLYNESTLPHHPPTEECDKLCISIVERNI